MAIKLTSVTGRSTPSMPLSADQARAVTAARSAVQPLMRDLEARANALRADNKRLVDGITDGALRRSVVSAL